jgi:Tol biopolymer transport system component
MLLAMAVLVAACRGGESGDGCGSCGWLIEEASRESAYPYVTLGGPLGDLFVGYPDHASPPPASVRWSNRGTGQSGPGHAGATQEGCGIFLFAGCSYSYHWSVYVPLTPGSNLIRVTADGPFYNMPASDEVTVDYVPSTAGLALPITEPDASRAYESFADFVVVRGTASGWELVTLDCIVEIAAAWEHCDTDQYIGPTGWALVASLVPGVNEMTIIGFDRRGQHASQSLTVIYRTDAPNPVSAVDDRAIVDLGSSAVLRPQGNDLSANGHALSIKLLGDPEHGTASLEPDGSVRYAPDQGYEGGDRFTYVVSDDHGGAARAELWLWMSMPSGLPLTYLSGNAATRCGFTASSADGDVTASGRWVTFTTCLSLPNIFYGDPTYSKVVAYDVLRHELSDLSTGPAGELRDGDSGSPAMSADGRYVVFASTVGNLTTQGGTGTRQIFRREIRTGSTIAVSPPPCTWDGVCSDRDSSAPAISGDGQAIAFYATDCLRWGCPENSIAGTYLFEPGAIFFAANPHADEPALSATGRLFAYTAGDGSLRVRDRSTGRYTTVCRGCSKPAFSGDDRLLAFVTAAGLVPEDTNGVADAYVRDLTTGELERVSIADNGDQATAATGDVAISGDGRFVAFASDAANLVAGDANGRSDIFARDRVEGRTVLIGGAISWGASTDPAITASGRYVVFTRGGSIYLAPNPLAS